MLRLICILLLLNYALSIRLPGENVDKTTLTTMGIKTIGWQGEDENYPTDLKVHHNYSKVSVQSPDDSFIQLTQDNDVHTEPNQKNSFFDNDDMSPQQEEDHFPSHSSIVGQKMSDYMDHSSSAIHGQQEKSTFPPQIYHEGKLEDDNTFLRQIPGFSTLDQGHGKFNSESGEAVTNQQHQAEAVQQQQTVNNTSRDSKYNPQKTKHRQSQNVEDSLTSKIHNAHQEGYPSNIPHDPNLVQDYEYQESVLQYSGNSNQEQYGPKQTPSQASVHLYDARTLEDVMRAESSQVQERQTTNFYDPHKSVDIYGYQYPSNNFIQQSARGFTECPKTATGQFVYELSCNQFLSCWKGRGVVQNCAPGTLFNPETLECDFPSKVKCIAGPNKLETQSSFGGALQQFKSTCPKGFSGVIPHDKHCAKFINCDRGTEHVMDCPPGTLFSVQINACDHSYKAECAFWNVDEATSPSHQHSQILKKICPDGFTGVLPHYRDCSKFINCNQGVENVMTCTPGTIFSIKSYACDYPYKAECVLLNTNVENVPNGDDNTYNQHTSISTNDNRYEVQELECSKGHGSAVPFNCTHYKVCDNKVWYLMACPPGTLLNLRTVMCEYPHAAVGCGTQFYNNFSQQNYGKNEQNGGNGQTTQSQEHYGVNQGAYHHNSGGQSTSAYDENQVGHHQNQGQTSNYHRNEGQHHHDLNGGTETSNSQSHNIYSQNQGGYHSQNQGQGQTSNYNRNEGQHQHDLNGGTKTSNSQSHNGYSQNQGGHHRQNQSQGQTYDRNESQYHHNLNGGTETSNSQSHNGYSQNQGGYHRQNQYQGQTSNYDRNEGQYHHDLNRGTETSNSQSHNGFGQNQGGYHRQNQDQGQTSNYDRNEGQYHHDLNRETETGNSQSHTVYDQNQGQNYNNQNRYGPTQSRDQNGRDEGAFHHSGDYDVNIHSSVQSSQTHTVYDQNQGGYHHQSQNDRNDNTYHHGSLVGNSQSHDANQGQYHYESSGGNYGQNSHISGQSSQTHNVYDQNQGGYHHQEQNYGLSNPDLKHDTVKCPADAAGMYAHPYDCSKFINCANGQTVIQDCPPGTLYDLKAKLCDHAQKVDCKRQNTKVSGASQDVKDFSPQNPQCPPYFTGLLPHPTICTKFLNCDNGQTFVQDCGPGTAYNHKIKGCDYPHSVECEDYGRLIDWRNQPFYHANTLTLNYDDEDQDIYNQHTSSSNKHISIDQKPNEDQNVHEWTDQSTQSIWVDRNQHQVTQATTKKPYHPHPPFPSTDLNADYEFGHEGVTLEVESVGTAESGWKNRKPFCEPLDYHCDVDDCIPHTMVCDGVKDCPNGFDEKDCEEKYIHQFALTPNTILAVREKERYSNISLMYCAKNCLEIKGFKCKSFSYRKDDGACFLSDVNVGESGALIISHPYNYYELKELTLDCSNLYVCPNKKCIRHEQVCDGVNDCTDRRDEKGCSAKSLGYQIILSGSDKNSEGRIEVRAFGKTGYVCDDRFGLRDADVVCREVGFPLGASEVKANSYYDKELKQPIFYLMDDVTCNGNETSLRDCDFNGWGVSNCEPQEVVGVVCKTPLEECPIDNWKCDSGKECIPLSFLCDDVFDCNDQSDEASAYCEDSTQLRLVGGNSKHEGRIEIRHHGIWGTICDDDFNDDSAKVVCKQLGFPGQATSKKDGFFGPGKGPIWLDQVFCQGNETGIERCVHWNWGEHNCEHAEDVGVICSGHQVEGSERNVKLESKVNVNGPSTAEILPEICGMRSDDVFLVDDNIQARVIKGSTAPVGDYPWQASLRIKNKLKPTHWCGAIVISQKFVLTAAHCLEWYSKGSYFVVAGDYNIDRNEGTEQEAFIEEFFIHEDFRKGQKMNNDIALVKLKGQGFKLTKHVQPLCLPDADLDYEKGLNCTISGFGSIESGKSGYSHQLRAGWIPLQSKEVCQMPQVYGKFITDGMICAGSLDEGVDACDGDSGGPLACLYEGYFTLFGITSWGHHCGHANKPGVYVKVSHYRKWIDETMKKNAA